MLYIINDYHNDETVHVFIYKAPRIPRLGIINIFLPGFKFLDPCGSCYGYGYGYAMRFVIIEETHYSGADRKYSTVDK